MKYLTQNKVKIKLKLFLRAGTHCHLVESVLGGYEDAARMMPCDETNTLQPPSPRPRHPKNADTHHLSVHAEKQVAVSLETRRIFLRKYI